MKVKISGPKSFSIVLNVQEDDPLQKIIDESHCPAIITAIRFGYPPQKIDCTDQTLQQSFDSVGISPGEKITLITQDVTQEVSVKTRINGEDAKLPVNASRIVLPEGQQRILQVHDVPDDNSCLFHAISYCFYKDIYVSPQLRSLVSQEVLADPVTYSDAVLDKPNKEYAAWILKKESWGGGIEIAILSRKLGVAIYVLDMDAQQFEKFNEDQFDQFIVIMFNGVHYDSVELDDGKTVFDKRDFLYTELILSGALHIGHKMKQTGHSFNTRKDVIVCNTCKTTMVGEREVAKHAEATGHVDFGQASC
ncbi:hypothetical protein HG536_0B06910 [Torulaspora globosa]|uniref:Ubiquitin thioesterase OTU n=1 Tax=Torulaspora globosa TaxID=48254 RepID=A0A7G3ZE87_9SACH|nr:uncharacterized protein HG536_0B06910 [Torulaspora globosa]QLL31823.1 hypothetical protein HG536_0B06910 [Torulaspora globosa]